MIPCPELRRGLFFPDARRLISHLVSDHLVSPSTATAEAGKTALNARIDAEIVRSLKDGAERYAPGPIVMVPKGTAAPILTPAPEEITMGTRPKTKADPSTCMVCARLTKKAGEPKACKRHGGAGVTPGDSGKPKKATGGGKHRAKKPRAAAEGSSVSKAEALLALEKVHVTELREELRRREARVEILMELAEA